MTLNGLNLITPTSISTSGSSSIDTNGSVIISGENYLIVNGIFSADYDNYLVVMRTVPSVASGSGYFMRMTSGGSQITGADYNQQLTYCQNTTLYGSYSSNQSYWTTTGVGGSTSNGAVMHFYQPFLSRPTAFTYHSASALNTAQIHDLNALHDVSSSYDGFFIWTAVNTWSGRLAVYGMRN